MIGYACALACITLLDGLSHMNPTVLLSKLALPGSCSGNQSLKQYTGLAVEVSSLQTLDGRR